MQSLSYYSNVRRDVQSLISQDITSILDVGCAQGNFLLALKSRFSHLETWGIEIDDNAAFTAKNNADHFFHSDFLSIYNELPKHEFDCITFNDVLEHLKDPDQVLSLSRELLKENGYIIVSLPNIRYFSAIYELIFRKDFPYQEHGIFDKTHLRFYTLKSALRLFESCGFFVESYRPTNLIARRYRYPLFILNALLLGLLSDSFCKQYIFKLRVA